MDDDRYDQLSEKNIQNKSSAHQRFFIYNVRVQKTYHTVLHAGKEYKKKYCVCERAAQPVVDLLLLIIIIIIITSISPHTYPMCIMSERYPTDTTRHIHIMGHPILKKAMKPMG